MDHRPQVVSGARFGAQSADDFYRVQQRQSRGLGRCACRWPEPAGHQYRLAGTGHAGGAVWHRVYRAVHFGATPGYAA